MIRFYLLALTISIAQHNYAQSSDILSITKKNGQHLKSFFTGSPITFKTTTANHISGNITTIKNDSIYIKTYSMGQFLTNYGFTIIDTLNSYHTSFHYKDIASIKLHTRKTLLQKNLSPILVTAGLGYTALNIINTISQNQSLANKQNIKNLSIALSTIILGKAIQKIFPVTIYSKKIHKINYINMQTNN